MRTTPQGTLQFYSDVTILSRIIYPEMVGIRDLKNTFHENTGFLFNKFCFTCLNL